MYKVLSAGNALITFDCTPGIKNNLNNLSNILIPVCSTMECQGYTKPICHTPPLFVFDHFKPTESEFNCSILAFLAAACVLSMLISIIDLDNSCLNQ